MVVNANKQSALARVSLAWAMPLVSLAFAMALAGLFLVVSLFAVEMRAANTSQQEAERIADMVSTDLAYAQMNGVGSIFQAYAPAGVTVLAVDGTRVATSWGVDAPEIVHRVPVNYDGELIGYVETSRLVESGLSIPGWGVVSLVLLAGGLAFGLLRGTTVRHAQETGDSLTSYHHWMGGRCGSSKPSTTSGGSPCS